MDSTAQREDIAGAGDARNIPDFFSRRYDMPSMVPRFARAVVRTPTFSEKLLRKGTGWRLEG